MEDEDFLITWVEMLCGGGEVPLELFRSILRLLSLAATDEGSSLVGLLPLALLLWLLSFPLSPLSFFIFSSPFDTVCFELNEEDVVPPCLARLDFLIDSALLELELVELLLLLLLLLRLFILLVASSFAEEELEVFTIFSESLSSIFFF